MANAQASFAKAVKAASRKSSSKELADALGNLVLKRLHARAVRQMQRIVATASPAAPYQAPAMPTKRRSGIRRAIGRIRFYKPTNRVDVSRPGTFRKYMIATIRAHMNTVAANAAHDLCTEPKFAKNRLDFNWAADNGFINWE